MCIKSKVEIDKNAHGQSCSCSEGVTSNSCLRDVKVCDKRSGYCYSFVNFSMLRAIYKYASHVDPNEMPHKWVSFFGLSLFEVQIILEESISDF